MADNWPKPSILLANRGCHLGKIQKTFAACIMVPIIRMGKTRKLRRVAVDRRLYRLRNLVEQCFSKLKNARRVAIRLATRRPKYSSTSSTSPPSACGSAVCQHGQCLRIVKECRERTEQHAHFCAPDVISATRDPCSMIRAALQDLECRSIRSDSPAEIERGAGFRQSSLCAPCNVEGPYRRR